MKFENYLKKTYENISHILPNAQRNLSKQFKNASKILTDASQQSRLDVASFGRLLLAPIFAVVALVIFIWQPAKALGSAIKKQSDLTLNLIKKSDSFKFSKEKKETLSKKFKKPKKTKIRNLLKNIKKITISSNKKTILFHKKEKESEKINKKNTPKKDN